MTLDDDLTIRPAQTPADFRACQDAQRRAWGLTEEGYVVPIATMVGAQHHGGLVLGAFTPDGRAAGLSFAFLGRIDGRLCLYSQLTGIVPEHQGRGLGGLLKEAQRDWARAQGIGLIAWAFDPLQAGNARFNLDRLGASAGTYLVDMYGPRTDALNAGTPTDRLIAEWPTVPISRPEPPPDLLRNAARLVSTDDAGPPASIADLRGAAWALLEIPPDIGRLRSEAPELAARWLAAVREAFQAAFAERWRAVGFRREASNGSDRGYYVLSRHNPD